MQNKRARDYVMKEFYEEEDIQNFGVQDLSGRVILKGSDAL